ncbi:MAG: hypothetical protein U9R54_08395, partial [Bacteroidota bacterium]|nr:hypothetical protein [Bacteroidota bacterium]
MENKNQNQENQENKQNQVTPPSKKKKSRSGIYFILFLLIALLAVVTWLYVDQKQTNVEIETKLTIEKDSLKSHLLSLRDEYDSLQTDNDTINAQLNFEKEKIDKLIRELKYVKSTNFAKIKELKSELSTLRKVAKSYIRQIDSLNIRNKELVTENIKVKNDIKVAKSNNIVLEEKNKDLSGKVNLAKQLQTENLNAFAINKRGKEKTKINKVEKIKVCFRIKANVLAKPGDRDVFIRIAGPDDYILAKSEDDLFEYQGQQVVYSAKRPIEYKNKNLDMCI